MEEFRKLYRAYEGYKERHEKLDFDDMLTQCYQLLREDAAVREYWQRKYKFILVDEFQDVNQAQFACLQIWQRSIRIFLWWGMMTRVFMPSAAQGLIFFCIFRRFILRQKK